MSIISQFHPHVLYHEADLSTYNRNAYTYEELAIEMGISLDDLTYGPTVVVIQDQRGSAIRSEKGTLALITAVDREIHEKEILVCGHTSKPCNIDYAIEAMNQFQVYNPWEDYDYYEPKKDEANHEMHSTKNCGGKIDQYGQVQ